VVRVAIASDHGGVRLKAELMSLCRERSAMTVIELGTSSEASCDYPDYAHEAALGILDGQYDRAILVCGTGVGMAIAANRHPGIRCVNCSDTYTAKLSRQHNAANVLALGERVVGKGLAWDIVRAWLDEPIDEDERHARRRDKIELAPTPTSASTRREKSFDP
jgi:ribose 5-phosphate isomerase B